MLLLAADYSATILPISDTVDESLSINQKGLAYKISTSLEDLYLKFLSSMDFRVGNQDTFDWLVVLHLVDRLKILDLLPSPVLVLHSFSDAT